MAQVILDEGAAAATPAASKVTVYAKADGLMYSKDDAGTETLMSSGSSSGFSPRSMCEGRLTLTSGTPVTTADVTAATTIYWALYKGDKIALFNGAAWVEKELAELSIAVPATTVTMYDLFIDYNAGTPILVATAWTNDTTRATALTTQDGVLVQTGNLDWRYVGSFRTTGVSGQTEDSNAKRYLWNYYNRKYRPMRVTESTDSWTYTTATIRQANAATANQLDFIIGFSEDSVYSHARATSTQSISDVQRWTGIGLDSTTAIATGCIAGTVRSATNNNNLASFAEYVTIPAVGRHTLVWLEYSEAAGSTTWLGDGGAPTLYLSGIHGLLKG